MMFNLHKCNMICTNCDCGPPFRGYTIPKVRCSESLNPKLHPTNLTITLTIGMVDLVNSGPVLKVYVCS